MIDLSKLSKGDEVRRANEPNGPIYEVIEEPEVNPLSGDVISVELDHMAMIGDGEQWELAE